jgi:hypothetical protein
VLSQPAPPISTTPSPSGSGALPNRLIEQQLAELVIT